MPPNPKGSIAIKLIPGAPNFHAHFVFNEFAVETTEGGVLLRVGFVDRKGIIEVFTALISKEGLDQMQKVSKDYMESLGEATDREDSSPLEDRSAPQFANYIRLAMAGDWGEVALYAVQLHDIGAAAKAKPGQQEGAHLVPIGLFHSELELHKQLVLALMAVET